MSAPSRDVPRAEVRAALEAAARASLRAPSVFNTQPWKWQLTGEALQMSSDPERRLGVTDAEGRLAVSVDGLAAAGGPRDHPDRRVAGRVARHGADG
jgi:hypothetical protein